MLKRSIDGSGLWLLPGILFLCLEIAAGGSPDCNDNGVPDTTETELAFEEVVYSSPTIQPVRADDVDGDGDLDILSFEGSPTLLAWYENIDGLGNFGPVSSISGPAAGGTVDVADVDGDGDSDILLGVPGGDVVSWFENLDGAGSFGPETSVGNGLPNPGRVWGADIDGDEAIDVVVGSSATGTIGWYRNLGQGDSFAPLVVITASEPGANTVQVADLDGDGRPDVLVGHLPTFEIRWYPNLSPGPFGSRQTVGFAWDTPGPTQLELEFHTTDRDRDGDVNVLAWGRQRTRGLIPITGDALSWFDNDGNGVFVRDTLGWSNWPQGGGLIWLDEPTDVDADGSPEALVWTFTGYQYLTDSIWDGVDLGIHPDHLGGGPTDLDGDGDFDILQGQTGSPPRTWLRNLSNDCNANQVPDTCPSELAAGDCNDSGLLDLCEIARGAVIDDAGLVDCDANGLLDACETNCTIGCDSDDDGCFDNMDDDPLSPTTCADTDGDACDDCQSGSFDPEEDGPDPDADGVCDVTDCAPQNPSAWSAPGSVDSLMLSGGASTLLSWEPPAIPGATYPQYDVVRSSRPSNLNTNALCLVTDVFFYTAGDNAVPAPGFMFVYVVRAETPCGSSVGPDSSGQPRVVTACP